MESMIGLAPPLLYPGVRAPDTNARQNYESIGYWLDDRGSRIRFLARAGNFVLAIMPRSALGPTQYVPALTPGVKRPERETDYSSPSSSEIKSQRSFTFTSPYVFMAWCLGTGTTLYCLSTRKEQYKSSGKFNVVCHFPKRDWIKSFWTEEHHATFIPSYQGPNFVFGVPRYLNVDGWWPSLSSVTQHSNGVL
jgi:hypothetical protein